MASATDKFKKASNGGIPVVATVQAPRTTGVSTLNVDTQQFWPTTTGVAFMTYKVNANNVKIPGSQVDWVGVSNGTNTVSGMVRVGGASDTGSAIGDKVQMGPTAQWGEDVIDGLASQHNVSDGSHKNLTTDTLTASGLVSAGSISTGGGITGSSVTTNGKGSFGQIQVTSGNTVTVDGSGNITPTTQIYRATGVAAAAVIKPPSFSWDACPLLLQIYSAAAQSLAFDTAYANISGVDTPISTVAGKWMTIAALYNLALTKWQIIAIETEA